MLVFHLLVSISLLLSITAYKHFPTAALKRTHHITSIRGCDKDDFTVVKPVSFSAIGASIICASLFLAPPIALAKSSGASVAFMKSEDAIESAQAEYKLFDKTWDGTKKSIEVGLP